MNQQQISPGFHPVRRDQLRVEYEHDSYRQHKKLAEPSVCPECGATFHAGRWQWGVRAKDSSAVVCPACLRIQDDFPAGFVHIKGEFFINNRQEILNLIEHHARYAKNEHPLSRIMAISEAADGSGGIVITTTDIHLARDMGDALHKAYHGKLDFHYNEAENLLRVHWQR
jgi:NMD protein affecting ribosome stability and mRNA decay